jgi:hypothetical protein
MSGNKTLEADVNTAKNKYYTILNSCLHNMGDSINVIDLLHYYYVLRPEIMIAIANRFEPEKRERPP